MMRSGGALLQNNKRLSVTITLIACFALLVMMQFRSPVVYGGSPQQGDTVNLKVMTYNIWLGGAQITLDKTAEVIRTAGADLVGIQEGGGNIPALAQKLGFHYNIGHQMLSRYPIMNSGNPDYVYIEVKPGKVVAFSNVHLTAYPYGPYDIRDGASVTSVLENEHAIHMEEMKSRFSTLPELSRRGIPVFLTGDFNVPSHLDWIEATKDSHFGITVTWPVSKKLEQLKFRDSYREIYPDPVTYPAYTWTPGSRGYVARDEVHDRIDFVYAAGPSRTIDSQVAGETGPYTDIALTPWPSDHRAVVSTFSTQLVPTPEIPVSTVTITTDKVSYLQGEPIVVSYTNAYGPKDWVGIYPTGAIANPGDPYFDWKYIEDPASGTLIFDSSALAPGTYDAILFYNDGYQELKRTMFTITVP